MTTKILTITPTVSTSPAYTSGDSVGTKLTLTNALGASNKGVLRGVVLVDMAKQNAAMSIVFFASDPTNTTFTDNGALDIHDTDALTLIGGITLVAGDYIGFADNSVAAKHTFELQLEGAGGTIYACMMTTGTPTYAATTDLTLKLYVEV
jgi:hypothetical protein